MLAHELAHAMLHSKEVRFNGDFQVNLRSEASSLCVRCEGQSSLLSLRSSNSRAEKAALRGADIEPEGIAKLAGAGAGTMAGRG